MNIFLDTSSLFKLYHKESDTENIDNIFNKTVVSSVFLSEITKIEFYSATWKKVRTQEISDSDAITLIGDFENDIPKYHFIQMENPILESAKSLITKYGKQGLRTLDGIQFATAIYLRDQCGIFVASDKLLHSLFLQESLSIPS